MLKGDDNATYISVRLLKRAILESKKPLVLWIGAGASCWLDYPLWLDLARELRREFFKFSSGFDNGRALAMIEEEKFPELFQACFDLDAARYNRFLAEAFSPLADTLLYSRFIEALKKIQPLSILTTNVDEALEQRLPNCAIYQHSDITGCLENLRAGRSFIAKLHGSRSAMQSMVFTRNDYLNLISDSAYLKALEQIFATSTVLFLGYSLRDQYLLDLISNQERDMSLFGAGPHFVVSPDFRETASLRRISYELKRFPDHRAALTVLEIVQQDISALLNEKGKIPAVSSVSQEKVPTKDNATGKTAYYISDFMPPGTWNTSITAQLQRPDGVTAEATVGLGFTNDELPFSVSTAAHDFIVGLVCFDELYFSLTSAHKVHDMLGGDSFWSLVQSDVLRFVYLQHEPAVILGTNEIIGGIGIISISDAQQKPDSPGSVIRRQFSAAPGEAMAAEALFSALENKVVIFEDAEKIELGNLVRASLMMPEVARLLGVSDALLPNQTPRWLTFPYLRMAHLIHTAAICDKLNIQAAKVPFGGERLTSAAFGVQPGTEFADACASYALAGRFNTDLGAMVMQQPSIVAAILKFRASADGHTFRKEIRDQLATGAASEFSASVNAGLARNIPTAILDKAKDKLSTLLAEKIIISPVPAVWTDSRQTDDVTKFWRSKSLRLLSQLAKERGVGKDDPCICGSGDKFRLCCIAPLKN